MQNLQKQVSGYLVKAPPAASIVNACNRLVDSISKNSLTPEAEQIFADLPRLFKPSTESAIVNALTEGLKFDSSTAAASLLSLIEDKKVLRDDPLAAEWIPVCSHSLLKSQSLVSKSSFAMLLNALIKSKSSVEALSIDPKNGGMSTNMQVVDVTPARN